VIFQDLDMWNPADSRRGEGSPLGTSTDNSNTQFATLALWVAQRHGVPMSRTLARVNRRFQTSQNGDGSWDYHYFDGGSPQGRATMTCVGLLGLAVGHGAARRVGDPAPADRPVDPRIINGLAALAGYLDEPIAARGPLNFYLLWSVERVGVLYDLPTIGDTDWYRWGVDLLLPSQTSAGSWENGDYTGHHPVLDTCLALLFLKRSNLASDLTRRLPFKPGDLALSVARRAGSQKKSESSGR
jgi:hypothetical protein